MSEQHLPDEVDAVSVPRPLHSYPKLTERLLLLTHLVEFSQQPVVVLGPSGAGKSAISAHLAGDGAEEHWHVVVVRAHDGLRREALVAALSEAFDLEVPASTGSEAGIAALRQRFAYLRHTHELPVIAIDDAEALPYEALTLLAEFTREDSARLVLFAERHPALDLGNEPGMATPHPIEIPPLTAADLPGFARTLADALGFLPKPLSDGEIRNFMAESGGRPGLLVTLLRQRQHGRGSTRRPREAKRKAGATQATGRKLPKLSLPALKRPQVSLPAPGRWLPAALAVMGLIVVAGVLTILLTTDPTASNVADSVDGSEEAPTTTKRLPLPDLDDLVTLPEADNLVARNISRDGPLEALAAADEAAAEEAATPAALAEGNEQSADAPVNLPAPEPEAEAVSAETADAPMATDLAESGAAAVPATADGEADATPANADEEAPLSAPTANAAPAPTSPPALTMPAPGSTAPSRDSTAFLPTPEPVRQQPVPPGETISTAKPTPDRDEASGTEPAKTQISVAAESESAPQPKAPPLEPPQLGALSIQLLGSFDKSAVYRFMRDVDSDLPRFVASSVREGRNWYVGLLGSFDSRVPAKEALAKLPESLKKRQPWLRSTADLPASAVDRL